jgi:uncharacterized protein (DUF736 family)
MSELNASFSLFPTQEKRSERSPDYSGSIEIPVADIDALVAHLGTQPEANWRDRDVIKLRIAGWKATYKGGKTYLNGKISIPQQQQQAPADDIDEDDVPF